MRVANGMVWNSDNKHFPTKQQLEFLKKIELSCICVVSISMNIAERC